MVGSGDMYTRQKYGINHSKAKLDEKGYDHKFVDPVPIKRTYLPDLSTGSQRSSTVYLLWEGLL